MHIGGSFKVAQSAEKMHVKSLRWFSHVEGRDQDRIVRLCWILKRGGRPPITWRKTVDKDLIALNLYPKTSHNREAWPIMTTRAAK